MEADKLADAVRAALADAKHLREVKMFGGIGFMLNENMVVAASNRGLLARIGKAGQAEALARPGARPMEMRGRVMEGYIRIDSDGLTKASVAQWVKRARVFVETLPPEASKAKVPKKPKKQRGKSK